VFFYSLGEIGGSAAGAMVGYSLVFLQCRSYLISVFGTI
jgi:hypothetical protein